MSGGHRRPAGRASREAAVDAVAVGIVGNDERALFGLRAVAKAAPATTSAART
jgi:hypothetical protein